MQKSSGIGRLQDASDVNVSLGSGVDGYTLNYDNDTGKFVLVEPVSPGSTALADCTDVNFSLGAGVDEYAICYDHDTAKFVLRAVAVGTFLKSDGSVTGASSQAQAFTNGVKAGLLFPAADSTTAINLTKANGSTAVVTIDTTVGDTFLTRSARFASSLVIVVLPSTPCSSDDVCERWSSHQRANITSPTPDHTKTTRTSTVTATFFCRPVAIFTPPFIF